MINDELIKTIWIDNSTIVFSKEIYLNWQKPRGLSFKVWISANKRTKLDLLFLHEIINNNVSHRVCQI